MQHSALTFMYVNEVLTVSTIITCHPVPFINDKLSLYLSHASLHLIHSHSLAGVRRY